MVGISTHYRPLLQVHDEIIFLVAQSKLDEAKTRLELVMRTPPQWGPDLPVNCEVKHGKSYGECK
jgi:DNA polymerase I-like protein with 3'-5' exonuclease and polymerase domains